MTKLYVLSPLLAILSLVTATYDTIPQGNITAIRTVIRNGKNLCCCTGAGNCNIWGNPCSGDLDYPLCNADEILHVDPQDQSYFGESKPFDTGTMCTNGCNWQQYKYTYFCAQCGYGWQRYDKGECTYGNLCAGCNKAPFEMLNSTTAPFNCITNPNPCPRISTLTDLYIKGKVQLVVDPDFKGRIQTTLITCAKSAFGARGGLVAVGSARCVPSDGYHPAPSGKSDYEIGKAVDFNVQLNDTTLCKSDDCMKSGYCAFNPTKSTCQGWVNTNTAAQNEQLKKFYNCTIQDSSLRTGAASSTPRWGHWETGETATPAKVGAFSQQLKAFCLNNPPCPGVSKSNPPPEVCNCY